MYVHVSHGIVHVNTRYHAHTTMYNVVICRHNEAKRRAQIYSPGIKSQLQPAIPRIRQGYKHKLATWRDPVLRYCANGTSRSTSSPMHFDSENDEQSNATRMRPQASTWVLHVFTCEHVHEGMHARIQAYIQTHSSIG
jgi:hypothetical protein